MLLPLNAYIKASNNLHRKTKDDWWPRSNISKCYRFLKSALSLSMPQLNFQKIEMPPFTSIYGKFWLISIWVNDDLPKKSLEEGEIVGNHSKKVSGQEHPPAARPWGPWGPWGPWWPGTTKCGRRVDVASTGWSYMNWVSEHVLKIVKIWWLNTQRLPEVCMLWYDFTEAASIYIMTFDKRIDTRKAPNLPSNKPNEDHVPQWSLVWQVSSFFLVYYLSLAMGWIKVRPTGSHEWRDFTGRTMLGLTTYTINDGK